MVPWGPIIETGFDKEDQLFNIKLDPKETNDLSTSEAEIMAKMKEELEEIVKKN